MTSATAAPALTESNTSRFIQTPDWRIHYNVAGEESDGPAVILLHGSGPGATGWSNFKSNLPEFGKHFRAYAVDMPGWGKSDSVTYDRRDHAVAAVQFMDALGIDKAVFVGNSMGGTTTLRMATEHPDRVSHVITMGAGTATPKLFTPNGGLSEGLKVLVDGYQNPSRESMKRLVQVMTYDSESFGTDELAQERADSTLANPDHVENYLAGLPHRGSVPAWFKQEDLPGITHPALLIHGRDDRVVHYENSLMLLAHIPDSRLVLLNRCGHWAQVEHANEFNRLVVDFILNN
ncbi:alpha/beta fold hydrolase [Rhodococcus sp. NPDC055024]